MSRNWKPERRDYVRSRWQAGLSALEIANEMGGGVTRNAVIGIIDRGGWNRGAVEVETGPKPSSTICWNNARLAELGRLALEGKTQAEAGEYFGVTKGAISKIAAKNGIRFDARGGKGLQPNARQPSVPPTLPPVPTPSRIVAAVPTAPSAKRGFRLPPPSGTRPADRKPPTIADDLSAAATPAVQHCGVEATFALRVGQCRFIHGSTRSDCYHYCCAPVARPGGSWCEEHVRLCLGGRTRAESFI